MESLDVRIDSIAAGGDGVGRHDGMVVFVPRTAPGDLARVQATRHAKLMRGILAEVREPSAQRVEPPCPHYDGDRCGGCQLQHLDYPAQRHAKSMIVRDAITRIARAPVDSPDVEASPRQWRYRAKLTLSMRPGYGGWIAGLHRYDAPHEIFLLADCPITDERVVAQWHSVLARGAQLPRADGLRGAVRLVEGGFTFSLDGGRDWPAASAFFEGLPALMELWWTPEGGRRRRVATRLATDAAGASFTQVNPEVAASLRDWVFKCVARYGPRTVIDAYAGAGDLAVALAGAGMRVTAIEIDRDAAGLCARRLPPGSRVIARAVEAALGEAMPADVIVVNPPRAGLHSRVTDLLMRSGSTSAVIYVSCNPATLARDIRRLDGWRIESLQAFDMFPQTAHVETVCELVPAA